MGRFNVVISPSRPAEGPEMVLDACDMASALTITDINLDHGIARIFQDGRAIANLRKRGGDHAAFWEVC